MVNSVREEIGGLLMQKLHYSGDIILFDLVLQRTHAHAEDFSRLATVRRKALERLANQFGLYVGCGRPESHAKVTRRFVTDVG